MTTPRVLFLDEPTTGLDPRSRNELWDLLRDLVRDGTTLLLTTQYLEEADRLADDIVVLDHGRTVAHGTPSQLKRQIGDERVEVTFAHAADLEPSAGMLAAFASNAPSIDGDRCQVSLPLRSGTRAVDVLRALDRAGIDVVDLTRRESTLDDVFLTLTEKVPA